MKYYFIINPNSGKFAADKEGFEERIDKACKIRDIEYELLYTSETGHAKELAASIEDDDCVIFSVGGDGNLNEVVNGVANNNYTVGVIPAGSGNDFYRTLKQMQYGKNMCDLGVINGKYFLNIACIGLDADIANNLDVVRKKKWIPVNQRYNFSILYTFFKYKFKKLTTIFGDNEKKGEYTIVTICNGQYYGNGHRIAPHAIADDGFFEIYLVEKMKKIAIPGLLIRLKMEKHEKSKKVVRYTDDHVIIKLEEPTACNIDGEMLIDTQFDISMKKGAVNVLNDPKFVDEVIGE